MFCRCRMFRFGSIQLGFQPFVWLVNFYFSIFELHRLDYTHTHTSRLGSFNFSANLFIFDSPPPRFLCFSSAWHGAHICVCVCNCFTQFLVSTFVGVAVSRAEPNRRVTTIFCSQFRGQQLVKLQACMSLVEASVHDTNFYFCLFSSRLVWCVAHRSGSRTNHH